MPIYPCIQLYLQVFVKVRKYTNYLLLVDLSFDLNAYTGVELPMSSWMHSMISPGLC